MTAERITPERSRSERLWGHPGLRPLSATQVAPGSPLLSYKWEFTDRALRDQLAIEAEGYGGTVEPGHAAVRYTNPHTGGDVLPTMRTEFHRIVRGAETAPVKETGSSVYQVFDGSGTVTVGDRTWTVTRGDLFVVPSWTPFSAKSEAGKDGLGFRRTRPFPLRRRTRLRSTAAQPNGDFTMRLTTIRTGGTTRAVKLDGDRLVDLGESDLGIFLAHEDWKLRAEAVSADDASTYPLEGADFAPVVPQPSKVICVGHNYTNHIKEMGRELPSYPTLFPKFADSLIGANDDIVRPDETEAFDWEVELVIVIGKQVRRADDAQAEAAIAGFTVMNDVSVRDWQFRTIEWTQGKIWDSTTPVGPFLVTPDEVGGVRPALEVTTTVDGEVMQRDDTGTLLFDPITLVKYISTITRLNPGDMIATGTPAGVGHARDPKVYLLGGESVVTAISGLGACTNKVVKE